MKRLLQARLVELSRDVRRLGHQAVKDGYVRPYNDRKTEMQDTWLQMNMLSRTVHQVPGDGDCMYASLEQLFCVDPHLLRAAIIGYARCNPMAVPPAGTRILSLLVWWGHSLLLP